MHPPPAVGLEHGRVVRSAGRVQDVPDDLLVVIFVREHIAKAGELGRKLEALASGLEDARAEVLRREGIRDRLNAELDTARTHRRFGDQHQKTLIKENAQQLAAAISRRGSAASAPGICETCSPSTASSPGLHNGQFAYLSGFIRSEGCFVSINRATVVVQR